jgi:plastocyanin
MDNLNKPVNGSKNKNIIIVLGLVVVAAIIVAVIVLNLNLSSNQLSNNNSNVPVDAQVYVPEVADEELIPEALKEAVVTVVGANPISKEGVVVTPAGEVAKNDSIPLSPEAPKQTAPVSRDDLPASVIKLEISENGWSPAEFSVKAGAPITIAVTSVDDYNHAFMFDDPSLSSVLVFVSPYDTRAITFNSPSTPGEYTFRCDIPGHADRGEVGKMIVQ